MRFFKKKKDTSTWEQYDHQEEIIDGVLTFTINKNSLIKNLNESFGKFMSDEGIDETYKVTLSKEEAAQWECSADRDLLHINQMSIGSNNICWSNAKVLKASRPFSIWSSNCNTTFSISQAKQLRDYLNEKIKYLES